MSADKKQTHLSDIKDKLKKSVLRLYDIPDYGQVDLNLVNMANFFPLLKDLIDSVGPKIICEIGSDQGMTSDLLYQYCRGANTRLHVVDPALHGKCKSDNIVTYYREMSLSYLQKADPADMYFIDGDHNHFTVLNELRSIRDRNHEDSFKVLFLHDVGWPCGYMDMYYNTSAIEENYRKEATSGLNVSVFYSQNATGKQGLPIDEVSVAIEDGGEANGVLTAVENFLVESPNWKYFSIPSIYGLGVLWYGYDIKPEVAEKLERLSEYFRAFRPFLSILEFNRILLLENLQESGECWKEQHKFIKAQTNQVEELKNQIQDLSWICQSLEEKSVVQGRIWKEQKEYIEVQNNQIEELRATCQSLEEKSVVQGWIWKEQKEYIEVQNNQIEELRATCQALEEKCVAQGREWCAQRDYISELISRNIKLDLKVMELESPMGIVRSMIQKIIRKVKN